MPIAASIRRRFERGAVGALIAGSIAAGIAAAPARAVAQEPELATDRPDFTESAVVVPLRSVQIESGLTWERFDGDLSVVTLPEVLIRWSPAARIEARFEPPNRVSLRNGADESGFTDIAAGAKFQIGPVGAWDVAAIGMLSIPTGEEGFTSDEVDPDIALTAARALTERVSFGVQAVAAWPSAGDERTTVLGGTLVVGADLDARWGAFLELAIESPESEPPATVLHHGYTFGIAPAVQLDFHGGVGLSDAAPNHFLGVGLSARP